MRKVLTVLLIVLLIFISHALKTYERRLALCLIEGEVGDGETLEFVGKLLDQHSVESTCETAPRLPLITDIIL